MKIVKLEGCGNDFIFTEDPEWKKIEDKAAFVQKICSRNFGVGSDGFAYLTLSEENTCEWDFYNSDGSDAEMCGNAARCVGAYLNKSRKWRHTKLITSSGPIEIDSLESGYKVLMTLQGHLEKLEDNIYFANTGVPHIVCVGSRNESEDIKKYRFFNNKMNEAGCNISFIKRSAEPYQVKSFERGVENFTLACGTGAVAAALVVKELEKKNCIKIEMPGGPLEVLFEDEKTYLIGPAKWILEGDYNEF